VRLQFLGGIAVLLMSWAFLNMPDQRAWQIVVSGVLALAVFGAAVWLMAANFARTPVASAACLITLILLFWVLSLLDGDLATPIASWLSLETKKPVSPAAVGRWMYWILFAIRWLLLPLLIVPIVLRARFRRFALLYLALFPVGIIAPHYIAHWVPKVSGLWPEVFSVIARFGLAYTLLIISWVTLGRATREEAR
jgi:hypothetical protein